MVGPISSSTSTFPTTTAPSNSAPASTTSINSSLAPIRVSTGLVSGINFGTLISALLAIRQIPITNLQNNITNLQTKETALLNIQANLLSLQTSAQALSLPSLFSQTTVASSNTNILTATGSSVATTGAFTFTPIQLATSNQLISNGYADPAKTIVAPSGGIITITGGGGFLDRQTPLSFLNGQSGVNKGVIKITDSSGKVGLIDLSGAQTVGDVINSINSNTSVNVRASISGDKIVVQDFAGGVPGNFSIQNSGLGTTASDLGIAGTGVSVGGGTFIYGTNINYATTSTSTNLLNDGIGIRTNVTAGLSDFTITAKDGTAIAVTIPSTATTVSGILNAINTAPLNGGKVVASLSGDGTRIVLQDTTAGAGSLTITKASGSNAAVDLGFGAIQQNNTFLQTPVVDTNGNTVATGNFLVGNRIIPTLNSLSRNELNGGMNVTTTTDLKGIRDGTISITDRLGNTVSLNLNSRVQSAITTGGTNSIGLASTAGLAVGNKITFMQGGVIQTRTVTAITGTTVTLDSNLTTAVTAGTGNAYATTESLGDITNLINDRTKAAGVKVTVGINAAGSGLLVTDTSGGTGSLTISDVSGNASSDLGIAQSVSTPTIVGTDINPMFINENTALSTLNFGKGVQLATISITDASNKKFQVNLNQSTVTTVGNVIFQINNAATSAGSGIVARINDTGNGIFIQDTGAGAGTVSVSEVGATTAHDLNIFGVAPSATPKQIDGSFKRQVSIATGATLNSIVTAINNAGLQVTASVINNGSAVNPYQLSLLSKVSGQIGRLTVGTNISGLSFSTATPAQNATLLFGSAGGSSVPVALSSSTNTFTDVVKGLTVTLVSPSSTPVTVTVSQDTKGITNQVQKFTDAYNAVVDKFNQYDFFNSTTQSRGVLFADGTTRTIESTLTNFITAPVSGITTGQINTLAGVGIAFASDGQHITFDSSKLQSALSSTPTQVQNLFSLQKTINLGTKLSDLNSGRGVNDLKGVTDFNIYARDGITKLNINIDGITTLGALFNAITNATGNNGKIVPSISTDGFSIVLTDTTNPSAASYGVTSVGASPKTTFSDSALTGYGDNFFNGATIVFKTGANAGQQSTISGYTSSTGTFTLSSSLPNNIVAGDTFYIDRPMTVQNINGSTTASDLGISQTLSLDQTSLTGSIMIQKGNPGVGWVVNDGVNLITQSGTGLIPQSTSGIDDTIKRDQSDITNINNQVSQEEDRLVKQFAQLESFIAQSQATLGFLQATLSPMLSASQPTTGAIGSSSAARTSSALGTGGAIR